MRPLEDWFVDWLAEHRILHARADLPDLISERGQVIYRAWIREFREKAVGEEEAAEASERLYATPHHEDRHFLTFMDVLLALRSARAVGAAEDPEAAARRESRDCPECDGMGVAVRFRHQGSQRGLAAYLHCVCPLGRHLRARGRPFGPGPCLDLAEFPQLRGEDGISYRQPPRLETAAAARAGPPKSPREAWWRSRKSEANDG